jgi:hypothetical protein
VIVAIDPGTTRSAWLAFDGRVRGYGLEGNDELLARLTIAGLTGSGLEGVSVVVIEQIESYGMAVGAEIFDTVFWSGRFYQGLREGIARTRLGRRAVKIHLCNSPRANDANVRQAVLDRFGGSSARGTKAAPGPLYGVKADVWAALALAVTYHDRFVTRPTFPSAFPGSHV